MGRTSLASPRAVGRRCHRGVDRPRFADRRLADGDAVDHRPARRRQRAPRLRRGPRRVRRRRPWNPAGRRSCWRRRCRHRDARPRQRDRRSDAGCGVRRWHRLDDGPGRSHCRSVRPRARRHRGPTPRRASSVGSAGRCGSREPRPPGVARPAAPMGRWRDLGRRLCAAAHRLASAVDGRVGDLDQPSFDGGGIRCRPPRLPRWCRREPLPASSRRGSSTGGPPSSSSR